MWPSLAGRCRMSGRFGREPDVPSAVAATFTREIRRRLPALRFDDSGDEPSAFAVYTLTDPRDIRLVRYVGQTANPSRRHAQHVAAARLWLPDTTPWWITRPKL